MTSTAVGKRVPLSDLCETFADGDWIESKDQSRAGIRLIQTGNIGVGHFKAREGKARYISSSTFERLKCSEVFAGDCLISRLPDPVGRACIVPQADERMIAAVDCTILRFRLSEMLPAYFGYYAQSNQYFREVSSTTTGTTRTRISRTNLGQIRVPAPTLPEQQRIVGILDKAFENIAIAKANTEKNIANARELFQSARRNILSPCEHAWAVKSLGSLCVIKTGKRDVNEGNPLGAYPFFTCAKQHTYSDSYSFDTEAILIAGNGDVGTVSYYSGKFEAYQRTYVLATFDQISARLVFMQLEAFLKDTVSKQKLGNTMPYIKLGMLSDFPIALPPQEERAAITTLIEKTYTEERNLTDLLDRKLSTINELKRSLLAAAFNGEL